MGRLSGKIAIITGGARGMGEADARKFVSEGAKVVITDILEEEGKALAKELGDNAIFVQHDVRSEKGWNEVVEKAESEFGFVNVLVNNAAMAFNKPVDEMTLEEYKNIIEINQIGVFLGMRAVLPSMKKAKGGSIINMSSLAGFGGSDGNIAYDASKFAVRGMTKSAAIEFSDYGIRVNSVHPGMVATPILVKTEGADKVIKEFEQTIPMNRLGKPEEVANLVAFLASDDSSYSTGSEFTLDGGVSAKA